MTHPDDPSVAVAARFGQAPEWGRYHTTGRHVCVDGRWYNADCLVTDPDFERTARYFMAKTARR